MLTAAGRMLESALRDESRWDRECATRAGALFGAELSGALWLSDLTPVLKLVFKGISRNSVPKEGRCGCAHATVVA